MKVVGVFAVWLCIQAVYGYRYTKSNSGEYAIRDASPEYSGGSSEVDNSMMMSGEVGESAPEPSPARRKLGSNEREKPGSDEEKPCRSRLVFKTLESYRGFPMDMTVQDLEDYDQSVYEPLIDAFYANKSTNGFGKGRKKETYQAFVYSMVSTVLRRRFTCGGTKLTQILKYVISNAADQYFKDNMPTMFNTDEFRQHVRTVFETVILGFLDRVEFNDVACFAQEFRYLLKEKPTLDELKSQMIELADSNPDAFVCTDPSEALPYLSYQFLPDLAKNEGKLKKWISWSFRKNGYAKWLPRRMAGKVLQVYQNALAFLKQTSTIESNNEMIAFITPYLTPEEVNAASTLIMNLDIFEATPVSTAPPDTPFPTTAPPETPFPTTAAPETPFPTTAPSSRRGIVLRGQEELARILDELNELNYGKRGRW